jgi:hypothetical protein
MESTKRIIRLRIALVAVVAMIAVLLVATQAEATGVDVTVGRFETTVAGQEDGYNIRGFALMIRTPRGPDGRTHVRVFVRGLDANMTFPSHVHNGACDTGGGSHYQHDVGGLADAINEIWPTITTHRRGFGWGSASHSHWARPEAQSVVIHHPDGTRLACAQLR